MLWRELQNHKIDKILSIEALDKETLVSTEWILKWKTLLED